MEKTFFKSPFIATGVGSLPHSQTKKACDFIENNFKDQLIFWPQLPKVSFRESMYVQFSEKLPGVVVDEIKEKIYLNTEGNNFLKELEEAYLHALNNDYEYFAISQAYASGFHEMLSRPGLLKNLEYFKGQIIGPFSFGLSVTDQESRAIIYHPEAYEILVKILALKARWQIKKIKSQNTALKIIIFIDEPYLVSVGTSFVSIKKEKITNGINEIINAIHQEGALAGIHCCGNTDWEMVLETNLDILNFDAYNYLDNLLLYPQALDKLFNRKGILAWGIVPNDEQSLRTSNVDNLAERVGKIGAEKNILRNSVLVTPSCGCGTLSEQTSEEVHRLAIAIADKLSKKNY